MPLCVPLLFPFLSLERCWPTLLFCNELLCVTKNDKGYGERIMMRSCSYWNSSRKNVAAVPSRA